MQAYFLYRLKTCLAAIAFFPLSEKQRYYYQYMYMYIYTDIFLSLFH